MSKPEIAGIDPLLPVYDSSRRPPAFVEELQELYSYRDLVALWTARNITLRYKRSVLGVAWTLLEPLLLMAIMTIVFSALFRFELVNYPIYVLCGLITFDFFSRSTNHMIEEIITSQNLAQRIYLPRSAFAVAAVASYLFNWILAMILLLVIMLVLGHAITWALLLAPAAMLLTGLFALGVGLLIATLGAYFQDIKVTYAVLLSALFYATPIIYPIEIVPERFQPYLALNPMFLLIRLFRTPIYEGLWGTWTSWFAGGLVSVGTAALGWWVFARWRRAFEYRV